MKCRNWLYSVLFAFLGLSVGSFIINQRNSAFAVSDIVYTFTNNPYNNYYHLLCDGNCSSFNYLIFEFTPSDRILASNGGDFFNYFQFGLRYSSTNSYIRVPWIGGFYVVDVSSISSDIDRYWVTGNSSFQDGTQFSITVTLSENPPSSSAIVPSGSISITENGTYDVTQYSQAIVDVDTEVIYGDYHDDLVSINNTIMIGCAIPLVIYFFYAIYNMIMKGVRR